jgi:hypothetical protein
MTTQHFIDRLQELSAEHGPDLTLARFCALAGIGDKTIYRHFPGGWPALRAAAGLPPRAPTRKQLRDVDLLCPAITFYVRHGRMPTCDEINRLFPYSNATYARRFGSRKNLDRRVISFVNAERARRRAAADPPL